MSIRRGYKFNYRTRARDVLPMFVGISIIDTRKKMKFIWIFIRTHMAVEISTYMCPRMDDETRVSELARDIMERNGLTEDMIVSTKGNVVVDVAYYCMLDGLPYGYREYKHITSCIATFIIRSIVLWSGDRYRACITSLYYIMHELPMLFELNVVMRAITDMRATRDIVDDYMIIAPIISFIVTHDNESYYDLPKLIGSFCGVHNTDIIGRISEVVRNRAAYSDMCIDSGIGNLYEQVFP